MVLNGFHFGNGSCQQGAIGVPGQVRLGSNLNQCLRANGVLCVAVLIFFSAASSEQSEQIATSWTSLTARV